jgi:hypothetical protein
VVTAGVHKLQPGQAVRPYAGAASTAPMMPADAGPGSAVPAALAGVQRAS